MTDSSGNVTDTRTFDAFGKLLGSSGNNPDPFRAFAGFGLFWEAQYGGYSSGGAFFDPGLGLSQNDGGSVDGRPGPPSHRLRPMIAAVDGEGAAFLPGGPENRSPITDFQCKANGFSEWVDDWMFGGSAKRLGDTAQRYQMGTATGWELAYAITDFSVNMAANALMISAPIRAGIARAVEGGTSATKALVTVNRERGLAAQAMVGAKNTKRIYFDGRTRYRIPDILDKGIIGEVKSGKYISNTKQLRDYMQYADEMGLTFHLYVRRGAKLSRSLKDKIDQGKIVLHYIPE